MLNETILTAINEPKCAFLAGTYVGMGFGAKIIFYTAIMYFLFKAIDKLAFEPFIDWIKSKFKKVK